MTQNSLPWEANSCWFHWYRNAKPKFMEGHDTFSTSRQKLCIIPCSVIQICCFLFYVYSVTLASCPNNNTTQYNGKDRPIWNTWKKNLTSTSRKYQTRRSLAVNKYRFTKRVRKNMFVDHLTFVPQSAGYSEGQPSAVLAVTATLSWSLDISGPMGPLNPPWCMGVSAVKIPPCTRSSLVSQYTPFSYC